jgi:hypothetical protein
MATVIATGKSCTLKIAGTTYDEQINSATLTAQNNSITVQTYSGPASIQLPASWELTITAYQDQGKTGTPSSLFDALQAAAATGTAIAFELDLPNSKKFTGNVIPMYPDAGGAADGVLEFSLTMPVDGTPTYA